MVEADNSTASTASSGSNAGCEDAIKVLGKAKVTIDDFVVGKILGEGAYGKVMLCRAKATGQLVAIKSVV
jgi:serine/threonine protein kinase